jgi:RimJ/RimL family protein N-acetyltransferase
MPAINLFPLDTEALTTLSQRPEDFAAPLGLTLEPHRDLIWEVADQSLAFRKASTIVHPWAGYLAADSASGSVIGTCSFKGPPGAEGAVEIAYYTFPAFERRGYATAMADTLRKLALAEPAVQLVFACTAPEANGSTRVLEKLGFAFAGQVVDPEDGPIWRWESRPGE